VRRAEVVQLDRGLVAADASRLDVDDPAGLRSIASRAIRTV
jgi:hypothetical protein